MQAERVRYSQSSSVSFRVRDNTYLARNLNFARLREGGLLMKMSNDMDFVVSEFQALDKDGRGFVSREQVYEILIYQGVDPRNEKIEEQLRKLNGEVDLKCFVKFMNKIPSRTRKLREIFAIFTDDKKSLEASKEMVINGLENLGVQHNQKLIEEMINADDLITYENFARVFFTAKDLLS